MLSLTVLLFMLLPYLSHLLFPSLDLPKLTLPFFHLPLPILTTPFSILLISLDPFLRQVPQCLLESLPSLPILDLHFLTLSLCLLHPCLPWSLLALYLPPPLGRVQPNFGPSPSRRSIKVPRATSPGKRRAPRGRRRSRVTSTASCQTSPIPSYFWPDFQPSGVFSRGPSTEGALDLALMPRAYNHFPTSLPLDPLHFDFFTILRVASPVITFHCPSPLSQKSFSSVYSIHFPHGVDAKPILVTGIHR